MKKKTGIYVALCLVTALSLSSCLSMLTKIATNAMQKQLKEQIEQYDKMAVDEINAARIAGTWRSVTNMGVTVWSFSRDGKMDTAIQYWETAKRTISRLGTSRTLASFAYKISTDTLAQQYHDEAFAKANPKLIADTTSFLHYEFNNDYTELRIDFSGLGPEFALTFKKIDNEYTTDVGASLNVPISESQIATLVYGQAWQQPIQLKQKYGNKTIFDFGTSSSTTITINGKDLAFSAGSLDLPEGEYEIYFGETVKVENLSTGYSGTVVIEEQFHLTARKGHVYEINVVFDEENIARLSLTGVSRQSTWGYTVLMQELSLEQYHAKYL
jgi:hypothetical protein